MLYILGLYCFMVFKILILTNIKDTQLVYPRCSRVPYFAVRTVLDMRILMDGALLTLRVGRVWVQVGAD